MWKLNVSIGKKNYRYLGCLAEKDQVCKNHSMNLQKMWCFGLVPCIASTLEEIPSFSRKSLKRRIDVSSLEIMKKVKSDEKKGIISLDNLEPSIEAKGKMALVEKHEGSIDEDDPCRVEYILSMLEEADGLKKIGYLSIVQPSYDQD